MKDESSRFKVQSSKFRSALVRSALQSGLRIQGSKLKPALVRSPIVSGSGPGVQSSKEEVTGNG